MAELDRFLLQITSGMDATGRAGDTYPDRLARLRARLDALAAHRAAVEFELRHGGCRG